MNVAIIKFWIKIPVDDKTIKNLMAESVAICTS